MPMNSPLIHTIEVRNLVKKYGQVIALDDVSFSTKAGELFFLLGPSGCGKTTLLKILAGLEKEDSGKIFLRGKDVSSIESYKRGAPMVFQNYALWPHLNVKDNIAFGLVERRIPKNEIETRVAHVLERVGLKGLGSRMPGELSGGQQQRVVLARALVLNPDVILLDEPLSNLDAKLRHEMREEIEKLHKETDITFIYVTHDQVEALSLADRMAVMRSGKICATGRPFDLYHRPPNLFCADFLGESNMIKCTVRKSAGNSLFIQTPFGMWQAISTYPDQPTEGVAVMCMVRPESIKLGAGSANANKFKATILHYRMNGPAVIVLMQAGGITIKASVPNDYNISLKHGMTAEWFVEYENTVVIPE